VKACCYAPYPLWLCLNGHEWAKRQAERAGVGFEARDNGFRSTTDAAVLAAICSRPGSGKRDRIRRVDRHDSHLRAQQHHLHRRQIVFAHVPEAGQ
jgi:hypothetical protein